MTKKNFMFLLLTVLGGLMFALGMCMCLLPEWNAFTPGVVVTALGALTLMVLALVRWIQAGRPVKKIDWNKTGKIAYVVLACLVLGTGMALIMAVENMMLPGIAVGIVGILLLVGIVPVFKGLK
ncbi:MAG: hypothetical protein IJ461_04545 [Clostridia bacterium]|nr:hypothetical protein [Clostridia bacterium]